MQKKDTTATLVRVFIFYLQKYNESMTDTKNIFISNNSLNLSLIDGFVPDEVQLIPLGETKGRDGREFFLENVSQVIQDSIQHFNPNQESSAFDAVIDYEHQTKYSESNGAPAPAAGWIKQLIEKDDGLWGKVEWTPKACEHVKNKEYRYLSPVFAHDKSGKILYFINAGLTNMPNLELCAFNKPISNNKEDTKVNLLEALCNLLGLPEGSTEEDVVKAIETLKATKEVEPTTVPNTEEGTPEEKEQVAALVKIAEAVGIEVTDPDKIIEAINKRSANPAKYIEMEKYLSLNKRLGALENKIKEDKALIAINKAVTDGQLPPALKENALAIYNQMGEVAFNGFVSKLPKISVSASRSITGQPSGSSELADEEIAVCKNLGLSVEQYKKTKKGE